MLSNDQWRKTLHGQRKFPHKAASTGKFSLNLDFSLISLWYVDFFNSTQYICDQPSLKNLDEVNKTKHAMDQLKQEAAKWPLSHRVKQPPILFLSYFPGTISLKNEIHSNQNQIFIILAVLRWSVWRFCAAHLRVIAPGQHSLFWRNVAAVASRWQHCARLTGPIFEPRSSRSKHERVSARPTGR